MEDEAIFKSFLAQHSAALGHALVTHLYLCLCGMSIAMLVGIPLGVAVARVPKTRRIVMGCASVAQTIPSLAALALLIPLLGIGVPPTLIILALYAIYPMVKNSVIGINNIPHTILEAADALGLSRIERLRTIELPLAVPSILAGIRVSTAMTIGIATIAAYVGAGGLGEFIIQGLALNNMRLVLLGAIPAALLALLADSLLALAEKYLSPHVHKRRLKPFFIAGVCSLFIFIGVAAVLNQKKPDDRIVVASKNFTEQIVLGELMAQIIEAQTCLKVERKFNLGATDIVHQALLRADVDLYAEYSGTAYLTVMHKEKSDDNKTLFNEVAEYYARHFDLIWLKPFGFSNAQTLAVTKPIAERYQLKTLSDLVPYAPSLHLAAPAEFMKRPDAFLALQKSYGLSFNSIRSMEPNLMYSAIAHNEVDMIVVFATDGRLDKANIVALIDDRGFSVPYDAAPVIRRQKLESYPQLAQALALLYGLIDSETMKQLNAQVDLNKRLPHDVVRSFLHERGLAKKVFRE